MGADDEFFVLNGLDFSKWKYTFSKGSKKTSCRKKYYYFKGTDPKEIMITFYCFPHIVFVVADFAHVAAKSDI